VLLLPVDAGKTSSTDCRQAETEAECGLVFGVVRVWSALFSEMVQQLGVLRQTVPVVV